jgi:hypothetical protein
VQGRESVGLTMPAEMHLLYVCIYCGHYDLPNLCNIINCNYFTRVYFYSVYFEEEQFVDYKCKNVKCMNISLHECHSEPIRHLACAFLNRDIILYNTLGCGLFPECVKIC